MENVFLIPIDGTVAWDVIFECFIPSLKVHKIEIFFGFVFEICITVFLYYLCQNIKILQKKFFDQAIIGGDTIFPRSLRLSGIKFSLVWD